MTAPSATALAGVWTNPAAVRQLRAQREAREALRGVLAGLAVLFELADARRDEVRLEASRRDRLCAAERARMPP